MTALALLLTVPLSLVYLVVCYTDETGPVHIDALARTHLPAWRARTALAHAMRAPHRSRETPGGARMYFEDRVDAGRRLARLLLARGYTGEDTVVLGLPRGGVTVAFQVAEALGAPLDVWVVRKVGTPHHKELGLGAVAEGGIAYLDRDLIAARGRRGVRRAAARRAQGRRGEGTRGPLPGRGRAPQLPGRTVILVDDGIATGGTVRAALQSLRSRRPGRIVLAVPLAGDNVLEELQPLVEDLVCVLPVAELEAVGQAYADFPQVPDADVVALLARARARGQGLPLEPGA